MNTAHRFEHTFGNGSRLVLNLHPQYRPEASGIGDIACGLDIADEVEVSIDGQPSEYTGTYGHHPILRERAYLFRRPGEPRQHAVSAGKIDAAIEAILQTARAQLSPAWQQAYAVLGAALPYDPDYEELSRPGPQQAAAWERVQEEAQKTRQQALAHFLASGCPEALACAVERKRRGLADWEAVAHG